MTVGWIKVTDRLPNCREEVLAWVQDDEGFYGAVVASWRHHDEGIAWWASLGTTNNYRTIEADDGIVTHWQPLPEFPEESTSSPTI